MSIRLALHDAANNNTQDGATTTVTLKSGVMIKGRVKKPPQGMDTVLIETNDGGWETVVIEEIASVGSHR